MKIFIIFVAVVLGAVSVISSTSSLDYGRIVGGYQADIADFPYQVSLQIVGLHTCGGAIIAKNWVITAAHCFDGHIPAYMVKFRIGSSFYDNEGQLIKAEKVYKYPGFTMETMKNDVALVQTETDMIGSHIDIIKLPEINAEISAGKVAIVSGWGYLVQNGKYFPSNLRYVKLTVVDQSKCKNALALYREVDDSMFCATDLGKDACQGDSGGPVAIDGTLYGVVSWGIGCANPNLPGIFTRLSSPHIRAWIREITNL